MREDARGLYVQARLAPTSFALDLRAMMQRGDIDAMSFMFAEPVRDSWRTVGDGGSKYRERTVLEFPRLYDVSVVSFPAYPDTSADLRSVALVADVPMVPAGSAGGESMRRRRVAALARARANRNMVDALDIER
jgi:phage head maturation protease